MYKTNNDVKQMRYRFKKLPDDKQREFAFITKHLFLHLSKDKNNSTKYQTCIDNASNYHQLNSNLKSKTSTDNLNEIIANMLKHMDYRLFSYVCDIITTTPFRKFSWLDFGCRSIYAIDIESELKINFLNIVSMVNFISNKLKNNSIEDFEDYGMIEFLGNIRVVDDKTLSNYIQIPTQLGLMGYSVCTNDTKQKFLEKYDFSSRDPINLSEIASNIAKFELEEINTILDRF